jgi:sugar phosphate isomerase/epimerase
MLQVSISELTTFRWELADEIDRLAHHGFDALSIWRTKLSDIGPGRAATLLRKAGMRVSSLQWAGGFTGSDGRSFRDSVEDALQSIETAAALEADVLIVHAGCRGGHTRGHAHRLLADALEVLAPEALARGVTLAIKPMHPAAADGCDFLNDLAHAVRWIGRFDHPAVRLSLDLWQFGHEAGLEASIADLVPLTAVVQVADRRGLPSADRERLPPGQGTLRLGSLVAALVEHGYAGDFELEFVGEAVESLGYEQVLGQARLAADAWNRRIGVSAAVEQASVCEK